MRVSSGAAPETVTIGARFATAVRVTLPAGLRVAFPTSPPQAAALEATDSVRLRPDAAPAADGARSVTAVYPLVAWQTGELPAAELRATLSDSLGRTRVLTVRLRLPVVRSVLPADRRGVQPRGPAGVLGPNWSVRLLALLGALALLAAVLAYLVWRRRRAAHAVARARPAPDPRAAALAGLQRARALRPATPAEWKAFYTLLSDAVRGYAAALSPRWGRELTTAELSARLRAAGRDDAAMRQLLGRADCVKFARHQPADDVAARDLEAAQAWVAAVSAPDAAARTEEAA